MFKWETSWDFYFYSQKMSCVQRYSEEFRVMRVFAMILYVYIDGMLLKPHPQDNREFGDI